MIRDSSRILAPGMGIVRLHPTQLEAGLSQYRNSGLNTRFNPLIILCFNWIFSIWLLIHSFSVSSELFDTYISASSCHLLSALQVVLLTFHLCGSIVEHDLQNIQFYDNCFVTKYYQLFWHSMNDQLLAQL